MPLDCLDHDTEDMTMLRRFALAALLASSLAAVPALAEYPDKPIHIVVPFAPGGSVDIMARLIAEKIAQPMGQSVIVDNKPGGGSAVGTEFVAHAPADGYTLLMGSTSSLSINPSLQKLRYEVTDFAPITLVASVPHVLVINPKIPAKNLREFIAWAKAAPKVNYGSAGPGTPHHLAGVMLNQMAGLKVVDIPYKGTGPALVDLVGGQVDVMSVDLPPAVPFISSNKVRVLGIATNARSPLAPDIPTISEEGLPGFVVTGWYGVVAPAAVPKEIAEKLGKAISDALAQPDTREKLLKIGATPEGGTPQQFGEHMQREYAKWAKVIKDGNIHLE
jgi:tripartite-type tricarboxylate transporter receptor subunit TctC